MPHRCYVNAIAQVSCQSPLSDSWFDAPLSFDTDYVRAQEPVTKGLIAPAESRRMSRILKRAAATALTALGEAGVAVPDAIITGTGMGCFENSEKFLLDLCRYGESCLKPTLFMQSTHNTVSALIAIMLRCHGYNNTYSHKDVSFESALLDAWMHIASGGATTVLAGSHDEVTPLTAAAMRSTHPEYAMVSEASVSAVLSAEPSASTLCELESVTIVNRPSTASLAAMLDARHDSVMMVGINGNALTDSPYATLLEALPFKPAMLRYRHVFGDCFSASALGFAAAAHIIARGRVPQHFAVARPVETPQRITLLNHSDGNLWSIVRLKKA